MAPKKGKPSPKLISSCDDEQIIIQYSRFIDFCKFEWFEKLNETLGILKTNVSNEAEEIIKKLYGCRNFSKKRHEIAMKLIDQQLKFKRKIEPLQFLTNAQKRRKFNGFRSNLECEDNFDMDSDDNSASDWENSSDQDSKNDSNSESESSKTTNYSYYCPKIAMINLKLDLEDIFNSSLVIDKSGSDQSVSKEKYTKMCKIEWTETLCDKLNFPIGVFEGLQPLLDRVYSANVYTEDIHKKLMSSIEREVKFKLGVSAIRTPDDSQSYYTATHSAKNLEIILEDILNI